MLGLTTKHNYLCVTESALVLERVTFRVLGVFLTPATAPELFVIARDLAQLYQILRSHVPNCLHRDGIRMFGLRHNIRGYCPQAIDKSRMGYYSCKKADALWHNLEAQLLIVGLTSAVCKLEGLVSPPMGAERTQKAEHSRHTGVWPKTPISMCAASTI